MNRCKEVRCEASVDAVRLDEDCNRCKSEGNQQEEGQCYVIAVFCRLFETITVLFTFFGDMRDAVLINAKRAEDGTVDSSEKQGHDNDCNQNDEARCQNCRHQLQFRHPAEPGMQRSREIQKQQCHQHKTDGC